MTVSTEAKLRSNEQLLRRCTSVETAKKLLPSLIDDVDTCTNQLDEVGVYSEHRIFKLRNLQDSVFLIPGFIDSCEVDDIMHKVLNKWIDNPPHANSLSTTLSGSMWKEYRSGNRSVAQLNKLRWSCVGFHYNWGNRSYDRDECSDFPTKLTTIYKEVLACLNQARGSGTDLVGEAQSAIINFYHSHRVSDRLGGHRDDVESTDATPLVAVSMGLPGFFLIENEALVLRSGDVLVMTDGARQSLHGVPCVVGPTSRSRGKDSSVARDTSEREAISNFLDNTRISISIRQVY